MAASRFEEPPLDCPRCPRLVAFRHELQGQYPDWKNAPVRSFGDIDARLLIVGLAPGMKGANRTGRPFTGDYAGDLLYSTLLKYGFAQGTYKADPKTACVCRLPHRPRRSLPAAGDKPWPWSSRSAGIPAGRDRGDAELKAIVALGKGAHDQILRALTVRRAGAIRSSIQAAQPADGLTPPTAIIARATHEHWAADDRDVP